MKTFLRVFGLAMVGASATAAGAPAQNQNAPSSSNALPSWDQEIPTSSRFVVLTAWGGEAVLDQETGLVWQQNPTANPNPVNLESALLYCVETPFGGRFGWRLPSAEEFYTLLDPNTGAMFAGSPFTFSYPIQADVATATTYNGSYLTVGVANNGAAPSTYFTGNDNPTNAIWCVRGYAGTQSPQ